MPKLTLDYELNAIILLLLAFDNAVLTQVNVMLLLWVLLVWVLSPRGGTSLAEVVLEGGKGWKVKVLYSYGGPRLRAIKRPRRVSMNEVGIFTNFVVVVIRLLAGTEKSTGPLRSDSFSTRVVESKSQHVTLISERLYLVERKFSDLGRALPYVPLNCGVLGDDESLASDSAAVKAVPIRGTISNAVSICKVVSTLICAILLTENGKWAALTRCVSEVKEVCKVPFCTVKVGKVAWRKLLRSVMTLLVSIGVSQKGSLIRRWSTFGSSTSKRENAQEFSHPWLPSITVLRVGLYVELLGSSSIVDGKRSLEKKVGANPRRLVKPEISSAVKAGTISRFTIVTETSSDMYMPIIYIIIQTAIMGVIAVPDSPQQWGTYSFIDTLQVPCKGEEGGNDRKFLIVVERQVLKIRSNSPKL